MSWWMGGAEPRDFWPRGSPCLDGDYNLAELTIALEVAMRLDHILELELPIDDGLQCAALKAL